ncbi:flagellin, partial [Bradyrhizobium nitroreducens]
SEITQIQQDMKNVASAATFNGVNWLSTNASTPTTVNLVSSFSRVGSTPTTSSITVTVANYSLYTSSTNGILDTVSGSASVDSLNIGALTDSAADQTILDGYIAKVTAAIGTVSSGAANLGAIKNRISNNSEFVKSLMDSVDRGIGQLVDADMNQESTRLAALQVQQQLGVQALSIANNNSQSILSLFR